MLQLYAQNKAKGEGKAYAVDRVFWLDKIITSAVHTSLIPRSYSMDNALRKETLDSEGGSRLTLEVPDLESSGNRPGSARGLSRGDEEVIRRMKKEACKFRLIAVPLYPLAHTRHF